MSILALGADGVRLLEIPCLGNEGDCQPAVMAGLSSERYMPVGLKNPGTALGAAC
jgi:hypothetical protein